MRIRTYLDFDLQIDELNATTFRARVLNSPAGQAEATFAFPFTEQDLEIFFLRIGRPRRGVRRIDSPEMNEARKFGSKLYKAVFQDALQACLLRSIDKAEQQEQGLRLRLRLPASLMDLPWEYLYDASLDRFFAHSTSTPLVRYLDLAQAIKPLAVTPPLKVLVMIASPSDYEQLDVESEWQKIEASVAELKQRGLIQLTRLPAATLGALQRQLRREQYHIFHFVGHGGFDRQTQDGVLLLEDESGRSRLVSGGALGTLLHDHASLRLALLNACEGGRTTRSDPFAGVAQQLVRQGIPAVIAMQFEITDKAAILLAKEFYDALADGYPVDGALAEARKAIFAAENDIEWGTPVLYLRAQDGHFFNIIPLSTAPGQTPIEPPKGDESKARQQMQPEAVKEIQPVTQASQRVSSPSDSEVKSDVQEELPRGDEQKERQKVQSEAITETSPAVQDSQFVSPLADSEVKAEPTKVKERKETQKVKPEVATGTPSVAQPSQPAITPTSSEAKSVQVELPKNKEPVQEKQSSSTTTKAERPLIEFDWVVIPTGEFWMGSDKRKDPNAYEDELPLHLVYLSEYALARVPVTNAQYKRFVDATGYARPDHWKNGEIPAGDKNHPVVYVTWQDAQAFCQWAKVRLPTEAEWEKAARGTDGRIYPWGNELPTADHANYNLGLDPGPGGLQGFLNLFRAKATSPVGIKGTTPVGKYPQGASPHGLLDMAGNVWEWVADFYNSEYYKNSPIENPQGPASGQYHVIRGGSWYNDARSVRSADRDWHYNVGDDLVGFRVVRSVSSGG